MWTRSFPESLAQVAEESVQEVEVALTDGGTDDVDFVPPSDNQV